MWECGRWHSYGVKYWSQKFPDWPITIRRF
jgi:hypothetical protein